MRLTSFSQSNLFEKCSRWWWYSYIKKVPVIQDMCYAHGGSIVHKILEMYYNGQTDLDILKEEFAKQWKKYKLDISKIKLKNDAYWGMVLNGINLKLNLTSTELKIIFEDVVAYLDGVNTKNNEICDFKSSTKTKDTDEEYIRQLKFYSYLYRRKFGRMPKKASVYYLKYTGSNGSLDFVPTTDDLIEIEDWHMGIRKKMQQIMVDNKLPPKCAVCDYWCPYKNLCVDSDEGVVKFTLKIQGNYIQLNGPITTILDKQLTRKFSYELKNAHFIKKAKPHANTTIKFWNLNRRTLPIGFKNQLVKTLTDYAKWKEKELALDLEDLRMFDDIKVKMPDKLNGIILRDYQEESVTAFFRKEVGGLQVGTGGGKTSIAGECIRRAGCKTLFIVDKIELMKQTKKRLGEMLGIPIGIIGSGEDSIEDVTVATMQTLAKNITKYAKYLSTVKFAIFDECHHSASKSIWKIGNRLDNTKYRLGLSATIKRDDGNDMMVHAIIGDIFHNVSSEELISKGWLVRPTVTFIKNYMPKDKIAITEQKCKTGLLNETPNYANFYNGFISENQWRNNEIKSLVDRHPNKKILILTKLIEHGKALQLLVPNSKHLYGETDKDLRAEMMDKFKNGDLKVMISTVSIWSEGLDMPSLDVIINASANAGDIRTVQMLGRVLRTLDGKKNAHFYDFEDEHKFFRLASIARKKILREEGHNVEVIEPPKALTIIEATKFGAIEMEHRKTGIIKKVKYDTDDKEELVYVSYRNKTHVMRKFSGLGMSIAILDKLKQQNVKNIIFKYERMTGDYEYYLASVDDYFKSNKDYAYDLDKQKFLSFDELKENMVELGQGVVL